MTARTKKSGGTPKKKRSGKLGKYAQNSIGGITPVISVIIPVYNVAPYLREALNSVVNQTYYSLEILVIDDGSTDGSGSICDEYKTDPRVTVIHQPNRGLSNARNTGLDAATGDFIAFLDPDDAWHPSFIEELFFAITDADIVVSRYTVQKTEGRLTSQRKIKNRIAGLRGAFPGAKAGIYGREDSLRMVANGMINWSVWNKLYRAELWENIHFPEGHNFEDVDTLYHIIDICNTVTVINPVLYFNRIRPGSITQTVNWKNLEDRKKAFSHFEEFVRAHTPEIFSEKDALKFRSTMLNGMIASYAQIRPDDEDLGEVQMEELRKEIIAMGQQIGKCTIKHRVAFFMLKHCPWMLNVAYSLYRPLRLLVMRVIGR